MAPSAPAFDPLCRTAVAPAANIDMIDDFEDQDNGCLRTAGRTGWWFAANDTAAGSARLPTPFGMTTLPNCANPTYAHIRGQGFTQWGSMLGLGIVQGGAQYDLSAYSGVRFWARIGKANNKTVRFRLPDKDTDPSGATCDIAGANATVGCHNHFGKDLTELTADWKLITITFAELTQLAGWGKQIPTGFDPKTVYSLDFFISSNATFDLWVDDIAFIRK